MNSSLHLWLSAVYSLVGSFTAPGLFSFASAADTAPQTVELFDGQTLDGWEGDPKYWRVENGAIVGEIAPGTKLNRNTWLVWRGGQVADFDLQLQFKLTGAAAANSGIQFRSQVQDIAHVSGYQADLDMGKTWLGRIYDEHGRALLVERGTRVAISADGQRQIESFAAPHQYTVLFRENAWNEYRIVAVGEHIAVYINGTLFSELRDSQTGHRDLRGALAIQLHSGPETRIELKDVRLRQLQVDQSPLDKFQFRDQPSGDEAREPGALPTDEAGNALNFDFESGTLDGWRATGNAFRDQPIRNDTISNRWPNHTSNKQGDFFIGGFEIVKDQATGTLESPVFRITHPYASMLLAGGNTPATRLEIVLCHEDGANGEVLFTALGNQSEQMRRLVADLRNHQGRLARLRLVDESRGGWGHLNFDDFRLHAVAPATGEVQVTGRSTRNPLLQHLVPNPLSAIDKKSDHPAKRTLEQMYVEPGFSVDLIAAEPDLHQPMAFTFDARGRLWVVEGYCYPQKRAPGQGLDRILILADNDSDGSFETRKVFAEGLNLVSGLAVGHGGVWVGAAPELLFIPDSDQNDTPDSQPVSVLDGFGYADTHETLNSFVWGPDGWLYGLQGVFNRSAVGPPGCAPQDRREFQAAVWRYHPTNGNFEVFAHGGSNPWGLDYDQHGQLFMTHCRSFWGGGPTTHVMRGGHYWNQVNSGYPAYISPSAPESLPHLKNFLLASARYGHGEGGAGKPGSKEVYGGHAHVGTMIYQGDNWPAEYRHALYTHNLHGHQMNRQVNRREGGGYHTVHAGRDMFLCIDPQYIGVALHVGPDGAAYLSDWYDPRHCHNPNVEEWNRGNGRIYRLKYDAAFAPASVNYYQASDRALADAQTHANDWHARAARLVLAERAAKRQIDDEAVARLYQLACEAPTAAGRLRGLWGLHACGRLTAEWLRQFAQDQDEYVRGWVIELAVQSLNDDQVADLLWQIARRESSLFVRRYLASAATTVPPELGWKIVERLLSQPENQADRELPGLIWFALAPLLDSDLPRGLALADASQLPVVQDWATWYAAKQSTLGRDALVSQLAAADEAEMARLLTIFGHAIGTSRGLPMPTQWTEIRGRLYQSPNMAIRSLAEKVGAGFGDETLLAKARLQLAQSASDETAIRHALELLDNYQSPANVEILLAHIDRPQVMRMLAKYTDDRIADALLERYQAWKPEQRNVAIEVLASRATWALRLMNVVRQGHIAKSDISSLVAQQMHHLNHPQLQRDLLELWGRVGGSAEHLREEISKTSGAYQAAPLWAFSAPAGAMHFQKLCAACHQPDATGKSLAPSLAGTRSKGIDYLVENIIDPDAVIGEDFQARIILTTDGRVITGLVESETQSALTIRTATESVVIAREDIEERKVSQNSFMPAGLLDKLDERERIELLKYVMSL